MFSANEFKKYATKHLNMNSMHLEKYMEVSVPNIHAFTPAPDECSQYGCFLPIDDGPDYLYGCTGK